MGALTWLSSWLSLVQLEQVLEFAFWSTLSVWAGVLISEAWFHWMEPGSTRSLSRREMSVMAIATVLFLAAWLSSLAHWAPVTWAALTRALAVVAAVGALGLGLLAVSSWMLTQPHRDEKTSRLSALLGASSGVVALMAYSFYLGFRFDPGAWFAQPSWKTAIATPWTRPILALTFSWSAFWGLVTSVHRSTPRADGNTRAVITLLAAAGSLLLLTQPHWLPTWLNPPYQLDTLMSGVGRESLAARTAIAASSVWLVSAALTSFTSSHPTSRLPTGIRTASLSMLVAGGWLLFVSLNAQRSPWSLGRAVYANEVKSEYLRLQRRLPTVTRTDWSFAGASSTERQRVGHLLIQRQCSSCHADRGPSSVESLVTTWPRSRLQQFLQQQREGDRPGHEWRRIMPPLVGSDDEVRAIVWTLNPEVSGR